MKLPLFLLLLLTILKQSKCYSFVNKKAVVTGSSGGIGSEIAKTLASKGARVMIHYNERYEGAKATNQFIADMGGKCDGIIQRYDIMIYIVFVCVCIL
jgi:NAD(P)-dependent dehydrogenase (short-subunit alcohol dehydrogenase family)